jgi:hypothetical protein
MSTYKSHVTDKTKKKKKKKKKKIFEVVKPQTAGT